MSYTEREYDHAVSCGIPVLGFVHAEPSEIKAGKTELDAEGQARLKGFREKVLGRVCAKWKTADELGSKVSRSLIQTIKLTPREGWVRARFASSPERINELRNQIDELQQELEDARVKPPISADGLAQGSELFDVQLLNDNAPSVSVSWDTIIGTLGPLMLNEADEADLIRALEGKLKSILGRPSYDRTQVDGDSFQTIKVQLVALGIIQQNNKKRAASDTETYWTLTPYGRHHTMQLRAIRSGR